MAAFSQSRALVVGIDAYESVARLGTAAADARAIARILQENQGYQVEVLLDEAATGAGLRQAVARLTAQVQADDRLLIYFAGHGVALDGEDGPEGFLVPQDGRADRASLLPMVEVSATLRALRCRHLLLVLDCCFAGAFRWSSLRSFVPEAPVLYRRRFERFVEAPAAQVLTSAAHDQRALDVLDGFTLGQRPAVAGHSPFAAALMAGLAGAADRPGPSGRPDGVITATELYLYVRDAVELATEQRGTLQTPGLWPLPGHGRGEYVFATRAELELPEDPRLDPASNPWRGLEAYEATHAALFFGREDVVASLVARLEDPEITVVSAIGASGVGKSSVAQAGVVPRLIERGWQVLGSVRPGATPLAALAAAIQAGRAATGPRLLVVDQLEELFTACRNPQERTATLALLAEVAETPGEFKLLFTLRSDFEAAFLPTALGPIIQRARFAVPPMSREELRAVITAPAEARVLYFEPPQLVDRLVDDVGLLPGGLPLLSFALSEMYLRAVQRGEEDRALTAADYEEIGQVGGCLRRRAERVFEAADEAGRRAIRHVLLRMIALEGGGVARRRVSLPELRAVDPAEDTRIEGTLTELTTARLLVATGGAEPGYEPAHDALVLGWDRLVAWLDAEAAVLPLQRALWRAASEWRDADRPRGRLWNDDPRLPQALALSPSHKNPLETEYLQASEVWRLRRRRRTRALVGGIIGISMAAAVVGFVLFGWARREEAEATRQKEVAVAALDGEKTARALEEAARQRAEAAQIEAESQRKEAVAAREEAEAAEKRAVSALAEARTQSLVATVAAGGASALGALLLPTLAGRPLPDGAYQAALRLGDGELPLALLTTLPRPVAGVAFSDDGRRLVAWAPPRAEVIEVATGVVVGDAEVAHLDAARLSHDGERLHLVGETGKVLSLPAVGRHEAAMEPAAPDALGREQGWTWPAYDPRYSTIAVGPSGVVARTDPRLESPDGSWFPPRAVRATGEGFIALEADGERALTWTRLDAGGVERERRVWSAAEVDAACGRCAEAEGDQVVGVGLARDGQTLAVVTGGDIEVEGQCGRPQLCILRRAGQELVRDPARSGPLGGGIWLGDSNPGLVTYDLDSGLGCAWQFSHGAELFSGAGRIQPDREGPGRLGDDGRCILVGGGDRGPVRQAVVGQDGTLALHGRGSPRSIRAASFITTADAHRAWVATGHADGTVLLWSAEPRPPLAVGWRPLPTDDLEGPADVVSASRRTEGQAPAAGTWAPTEGGVALGAPPVLLPMRAADAVDLADSIQLSPGGRLAMGRVAERGLAAWSLADPGPPLVVWPLRCFPDAMVSAAEATQFHPTRPEIVRWCESPVGPQAALADWPTILATVGAAVRGCLTVDQRIRFLGEAADEAAQAVATCRTTPRPLPGRTPSGPPAAVAPPSEAPPGVEGGGDPLPAVAVAPSAPAVRRAAQAANAAGMVRLGQGDRAGAAALFEQAVRLDPAYHLGRYNLGCMWALLGRHDAALGILEAFRATGCEPCRERLARARTDEDWQSLWADPRFQAIVGP